MPSEHAQGYQSKFGFFKNYSREAAFLDRIFRAHGSGIDSVLDIACGPGSHILELARMGYRCTAADIDPVMLGMTRRTAARQGLKVETRKADMRDFRLEGTFDAAMNMFYSFQNVLFSHQEQLSFLQGVRALLSGGGLLVIELLPEENNLRLYPPGQSFVVRDSREDDGSTVTVTSTSRIIDETTKEIVFLYETARPNGAIEREEIISPIRRVTLAQFGSLTAAAGFAMAGAYGGCDVNTAFTKDSLKLVAVLRKA